MKYRQGPAQSGWIRADQDLFKRLRAELLFLFDEIDCDHVIKIISLSVNV